jgi:hypothetical protein
VRRYRWAAAHVVAFALAAPLIAQAPRSLPDSTFARLVASLSEPSGYFDTDNLISNEDSYLHVAGTLRGLSSAGGAYIGVGPDQNFSYIAAARPRIAFIVDIRRDNLLHHLLLKSLFALSRSRVDYLCLLFGRQAPADTTGWGSRDIAALLTFIDTTRHSPDAAARTKSRVLEQVRRSPVPLSAADLATIARFHDTFITQGLALRFSSLGRAPQAYYPNYRRLLTETDLTGRQANFLAHEADFQFVRSLQLRNLIVPVVGDLGGGTAFPAVAAWLRASRESVTVLYTSNVEQYLFRDGTFGTFASTVARLPRTERSVMVRSYFQGGHPRQIAGYHATQVAQSMDTFAAVVAGRGFMSYRELVMWDFVRP